MMHSLLQHANTHSPDADYSTKEKPFLKNEALHLIGKNDHTGVEVMLKLDVRINGFNGSTCHLVVSMTKIAKNHCYGELTLESDQMTPASLVTFSLNSHILAITLTPFIQQLEPCRHAVIQETLYVEPRRQ